MPNPIPLDDAQIQHLCELARLQLPADQQAALRGKLQELVAAFSTLTEADLGEDTEPGRCAGEGDLRPDDAATPPSTQEVLANAPQTAADCFVVPRVLES